MSRYVCTHWALYTNSLNECSFVANGKTGQATGATPSDETFFFCFINFFNRNFLQFYTAGVASAG